MRPQLATIASAVDLLNTSGVADAIRQMQRQQAEVSRALSLVNKTAWQQDLLSVTRHLDELSREMADTLDKAHHSWLSDLMDVTAQSTQLATIAKLTMSDIAHHLATVKAFRDNVDFNTLGKALSIQQSIMADVQHSMATFTTSYRQLAESLWSSADIVKMPAFVLPGATREVFATGYVLDVLHPPDGHLETQDLDLEVHSVASDSLDHSDLVALLERVGPDFLAMYKGAIVALEGNNTERSRHVLTSLRELWNHLLRKLAPNEELREWITEQTDPRFLDNGKPTRYAKIRYVLKDLAHDPLIEFVEADTSAMVKLYALYGRLHEVATGVSDEQLRVIVLKTQSYLDYMLRAWEWSKE